MTRRSSIQVRLALLGDVLQLLRRRRHRVQSVLIRPDGAIEVRLIPPAMEAQEAALDAELEAWRKLHGDD